MPFRLLFIFCLKLIIRFHCDMALVCDSSLSLRDFYKKFSSLVVSNSAVRSLVTQGFLGESERVISFCEMDGSGLLL